MHELPVDFIGDPHGRTRRTGVEDGDAVGDGAASSIVIFDNSNAHKISLAAQSLGGCLEFRYRYEYGEREDSMDITEKCDAVAAGGSVAVGGAACTGAGDFPNGVRAWKARVLPLAHAALGS
jgi:hypothetical protein